MVKLVSMVLDHHSNHLTISPFHEVTFSEKTMIWDSDFFKCCYNKTELCNWDPLRYFLVGSLRPTSSVPKLRRPLKEVLPCGFLETHWHTRVHPLLRRPRKGHHHIAHFDRHRNHEGESPTQISSFADFVRCRRFREFRHSHANCINPFKKSQFEPNCSEPSDILRKWPSGNNRY